MRISNKCLRNLNWHRRVSCLWNGLEWDALACAPCTRGEDKGTFPLINSSFNIFQSLENFESIDYAVYKAGQLGLKLIVPLTGKFMNQNILYYSSDQQRAWHYIMLRLYLILKSTHCQTIGIITMVVFTTSWVGGASPSWRGLTTTVCVASRTSTPRMPSSPTPASWGTSRIMSETYWIMSTP